MSVENPCGDTDCVECYPVRLVHEHRVEWYRGPRPESFADRPEWFEETLGRHGIEVVETPFAPPGVILFGAPETGAVLFHHVGEPPPRLWRRFLRRLRHPWRRGGTLPGPLATMRFDPDERLPLDVERPDQ